MFTNKGLASCHSLKSVFGKAKYIIQSVEWRVGRSENQKNKKINNGECFFLCLGI